MDEEALWRSVKKSKRGSERCYRYDAENDEEKGGRCLESLKEIIKSQVVSLRM